MAKHTTIADSRFTPFLKHLSKNLYPLDLGLITFLSSKKSPGPIRIKLATLPRAKTTQVTLIGNRYKQVFWSGEPKHKLQKVIKLFLDTKQGKGFIQKVTK